MKKYLPIIIFLLLTFVCMANEDRYFITYNRTNNLGQTLYVGNNIWPEFDSSEPSQSYISNTIPPSFRLVVGSCDNSATYTKGQGNIDLTCPVEIPGVGIVHVYYGIIVIDPVRIEDAYFVNADGTKAEPTQCPTHSIKVETGTHSPGDAAYLQVFNGNEWHTVGGSLNPNGGIQELDWEDLKNIITPGTPFRFRTKRLLIGNEYTYSYFATELTYKAPFYNKDNISYAPHENGNLVTFTETSSVVEIQFLQDASHKTSLYPNEASSIDTILEPGFFEIDIIPDGYKECPLIIEELFVLELDKSGIQDYTANNGDTVQIRERGSAINIPLDIKYSSTQSITIKIDNSSYSHVLSDKITINEKDFWSGIVQSPPLAAGTYNISAIDGNNFLSRLSKDTLAEPIPINFELESPIGTYDIVSSNVQGGIGNYTGTERLTNREWGWNNVTITDTFNNSSTGQVFVGGILSLEINSQTPPSISCSDDGLVNLLPEEGIPPYTFSSDNISYQTSSTLDGYTTGDGQFAYIRDSIGVVDSVPVIFSEPKPMIVESPVSLPPTCINGTDGTYTCHVNNVKGTLSATIEGSIDNISINQVENTVTITDLPSGSYNFTITDSFNGFDCDLSGSFVIPEKDPIIINGEVIYNNQCNGDNSGWILYTVSGSTAPYSLYNGTTKIGDSYTENGTTYLKAENLPAGTYSNFSIEDYNGCKISAPSATVSQPDELTVTIDSVYDNLCYGDSQGWIRYNVSGGTAPYKLLNGATELAFTENNDTYLNAENLPAGTYENFRITDLNGCSDTVPSATVSQPERLTILNLQTTHTTCELDNGKIMAGAEGGVSPYVFTWSQTGSEFLQVDSLMETTDVSFIDSLIYGQYNLRIEDLHQCQTDTIIDVHTYVNPAIDSAPGVNPTCFGDTDGSVEVIPIIGSSSIASYELRDTINELISSNNTGRFDGLADGTYHLYVTDTTGCESNSPHPATLRQPDSLIVVNNSVFHVISKDEGSGYINNTIEGGNDGANEIKLISSSDITLSTIERTRNNPFEFSGLFADTYSIHAVDPKGCEFTLENIEVAEPDTALGFRIISKYDALCKAQTGSFTVEAYGGWGGPYGYKRISDSEFMQTNNFRGLSAGNYQLTVRDSRGGTFTDSIFIYEPVDSLMAYLTDKNPPTCGNNGNITLYISGGTSPYNLIGKGESDTIFIGGSQQLHLDSLGAGDYIFYITDANGCDFVLEASLPGTDILGIDGFNIKYPTGPGESDGEIEVMASGGNQPYLFSWKDMDGTEFPETGANITGVPSGNYLVTVTENNGCTHSASGYLPDIDDVPLLLVEKRDETSFQANNGYALHISDINVLNEVKIITPDSQVFRFEITDSTNLFYLREDTLYLQNLPGGKYRILATDIHGVTAYNEFFIKPYAEFLVGEVQITHARRIDEGSGSITVFVTGGAGEYDFTWESLTVNVDTLFTEGFENTSTLSGAYAGLYRFTATDKYHNIISDTFEINQPDAPLKIIITESANVTCKNAGNANVVVDGQGGWGNYQYRVDFHEAFSNDPMYTNLDAGEYYFYVIDRSGVQDSIAITITEPDYLRAAIESVDSVQCTGFHDGNFHFNISGGTEPYFFSESQFSEWKGGAVAQDYAEGTSTFTFTDSNQCVGMDTLTAYMPEPDSLLFHDIIVNHTKCDTDNGAIEVSMHGGTKPYRYQWYNINSESIGNSNFISGLAQNGYYYLDVYDQNNCHTEFEQSIKPSSKPDITKINLTDVICFGDSTGTAEVTDLVPGVPFAPYSITWSHGLTGDFAGGFEKGVHHVSISDTNNCVTKKFFNIDSPDRLLASVTGTKDAHCFGYNDGFLEVQPHGGAGGYKYNWSSGTTTNRADNLYAGTYSLKLTDANECLTTYTFDILEPELVTVDLGDDILICPGNSITLDGQDFTSHSWSASGEVFSQERQVTLSEQNEYYLEVTNDIGCFGHDTIFLEIGNNALKADFLMASESFLGDTIFIYELSNMVLDSLLWEYNPDVFTSLSGFADPDYILNLESHSTGIYNVGLWAYSGGCTSNAVKQIQIVNDSGESPNDDFLGHKDPLIKELSIYPNPTDGVFTAIVRLREESDINLVVFSVGYGVVMDQRMEYGLSEYEIPYQLSNLNSGTYVIMVTAQNERKQVKIIIR